MEYKISSKRGFVIMLLIVFSIWAVRYWKTPEENYEGVRIGFGYEYHQRAIMTAAMSSQNEFNIDDITLDFYYGWNDFIFKFKDEKIEFSSNNEESFLVGLGLYFIGDSGQKNNEFTNQVEFNDHTERLHASFIKIIPIEEFGTEMYRVNNTRRGGKKLNHVETLTIPKECLNKFPGYTQNKITFILDFIRYHPENKVYLSNLASELTLKYEYLNGNMIKIFSSKTSYN